MLILLSVLISKSASADLPQGTRHEINGEQHQCYDLPAFKEVVKLDVEYRLLINEKIIIEQRLQNALSQNLLLTSTVDLQKETINLYFTENSRLYDLWVKENKKRHEAENKSRFGNFIGWSLAGGFALTTASMTLAFVLK